MSFLPPTDPGHAIILIEADPFVADTTIDWDSVVTKGDTRIVLKDETQRKKEIFDCYPTGGCGLYAISKSREFLGFAASS
jgi:hypothetical protein